MCKIRPCIAHLVSIAEKNLYLSLGADGRVIVSADDTWNVRIITVQLTCLPDSADSGGYGDLEGR